MHALLQGKCLELKKRTLARARVNEHAEAIWKKTLLEAQQGVVMSLRFGGSRLVSRGTVD